MKTKLSLLLLGTLALAIVIPVRGFETGTDSSGNAVSPLPDDYNTQNLVGEPKEKTSAQFNDEQRKKEKEEEKKKQEEKEKEIKDIVDKLSKLTGPDGKPIYSEAELTQLANTLKTAPPEVVHKMFKDVNDPSTYKDMQNLAKTNPQAIKNLAREMSWAKNGKEYNDIYIEQVKKGTMNTIQDSKTNPARLKDSRGLYGDLEKNNDKYQKVLDSDPNKSSREKMTEQIKKDYPKAINEKGSAPQDLSATNSRKRDSSAPITPDGNQTDGSQQQGGGGGGQQQGGGGGGQQQGGGQQGGQPPMDPSQMMKMMQDQKNADDQKKALEDMKKAIEDQKKDSTSSEDDEKLEELKKQIEKLEKKLDEQEANQDSNVTKVKDGVYILEDNTVIDLNNRVVITTDGKTHTF